MRRLLALILCLMLSAALCAGCKSRDAAYSIRLVDETGAPVVGAMVTVCTDKSCFPSFSDENGTIAFAGEPYPYALHVMTVPEGYAFDSDREIIMEDTAVEIVVPHA